MVIGEENNLQKLRELDVGCSRDFGSQALESLDLREIEPGTSGKVGQLFPAFFVLFVKKKVDVPNGNKVSNKRRKVRKSTRQKILYTRFLDGL